MPQGRLEVVIDGAPLPEAEAKAFWQRFSAHMDKNQGDLAGFAQAEGLASVHPESRSGKAVLVGSRTQPQRPYGAPANNPDTNGKRR